MFICHILPYVIFPPYVHTYMLCIYSRVTLTRVMCNCCHVFFLYASPPLLFDDVSLLPPVFLCSIVIGFF